MSGFHPMWGTGLPPIIQVAMSYALNIRFAVEDDVDALVRLARLGSTQPPRGAVLVAEVGRSIWAAISLDSAQAVSDPRKPTGDLVWTLAQRAREVRRAARGQWQLLPRVFPADDVLAS
jgi:hypothetical protein